jgi:hypothetical protein
VTIGGWDTPPRSPSSIKFEPASGKRHSADVWVTAQTGAICVGIGRDHPTFASAQTVGLKVRAPPLALKQ